MKARQDKRGGYPRVSVTVPGGTVLARTVSHVLDGKGRQRLETQLLHFSGSEWNACTYRWNDAQTDAELVKADGESAAITVRDAAAPEGRRRLDWRFHSRAECLRCHNTEAGSVLGFYPGQLLAGEQAATLRDAGVVDEAFATLARQHPLAALHDTGAPVELRARSWLHANAVRTESARYVEWHQGWGLDTPIVAREFYRYTAAQPDEVRNEVEDAANKSDVEKHAAMLRELKF